MKLVFKHFLIKTLTDCKFAIIRSKNNCEYEEFDAIATLQQHVMNSMPKWYQLIYKK